MRGEELVAEEPLEAAVLRGAGLLQQLLLLLRGPLDPVCGGEDGSEPLHRRPLAPDRRNTDDAVFVDKGVE
ncbi:hypothetical protein DSECCO2_571780 [anaerobic digester metagenome]